MLELLGSISKVAMTLAPKYNKNLEQLCVAWKKIDGLPGGSDQNPVTRSLRMRRLAASSCPLGCFWAKIQKPT